MSVRDVIVKCPGRGVITRGCGITAIETESGAGRPAPWATGASSGAASATTIAPQQKSSFRVMITLRINRTIPHPAPDAPTVCISYSRTATVE
jgi:hypothetical protein